MAPNALSLARIALVPVFVWLLLSGRSHADELAAAADAERVAKLRGMPDVDAVQSAIAWASETVDLDAIPGRMLQGLKDAGFERRER